MTQTHRRLRALCEGALAVALAQLLGYLKISPLPNGGSLSFVMLPIFVYCARWGGGWGLLSSFALGTLQFLLDGGFALGWQSILGDYVIAYGVIGVAGFFRRCRKGFFIGTVVGSVLRFIVAGITGATLWAEWMPERFFGMTMTSPWIYSALYNGSYILVCMALCLVAGWAMWKPCGRILRGEDLG